MERPPKLNDDLNKPCWELRKAFVDFLDAVGVLFPDLQAKQTKRYSALYYYGAPIMYIDPHKAGIVVGFFRDYVNDYWDLSGTVLAELPPWNTSKGGLIGFRIDGEGKKLNFQLRAAARLLFYSVERKETRLP